MGVRKRKSRSLSGTHLFVKPSTGIYWWRRTDPSSGKRIKRTTGTKNLQVALKLAQTFEEEWAQQTLGLTVLDNWKLELRPLAEEWLAVQAQELCATYLPQKAMRLYRALDLLSLRKAKDLDNVARIHDRLLALEGFTRTSKRRAFQDVLKQFSGWLAANRRYLPRDPLLNWTPIKQNPPSKRRRALLPDEMARALWALDYLDRRYGRRSQRLLITTLLVAAPRVNALLSRDVEHLDLRVSRIDLGASRGKKRRGAACLDPRTLAEVVESLEGRTEGPLFLSAQGIRPAAGRVLKQFREAVGLGVVRELWPEEEAWNEKLAFMVNAALLRGEVRGLAGNPSMIREETRREHEKLQEQVFVISARIEREWERRMDGVDLHALRKTHRSWAQARGVPPVLIDKQLGHADPGDMGVMRALAGSETGRKYYLDLGSDLFDAGLSALAVRELLSQSRL